MTSSEGRVLELLLTALVGSIVFGIVGYLAIVHGGSIGSKELIDAIWFSVQTVTTTGYGSFPDSVWTPKLKLLSVCIMLVGPTVWTFLLGFIVNMAHHQFMKDVGGSTQ